MKRKFVLIGGGVIALAAIVAGVLIWRNQATPAATSVRAQTISVQRGSLAASVSAAGNVSSPNQIALAFQTTGAVTKVHVAVGDLVKKDQVLLELDTTDLNLALKTAQANLASTQTNYEQTKTNLAFALRNAQISAENAKVNLEAAKAKNDQNPNSLAIAKATLDKAAVTLNQAQGNYNKIAWRPDVGMSAEASTLHQATIDYQTALANYKTTEATINDSAFRQAQAQSAQSEIALEQAQKNLDTDLRVAQAQLDNAQVAVEQARRNLDKAKVSAPFDGAIATVAFSVGDYAGTGTAVTVVDFSKLQIKVTVAEVDIAKIRVGNPAQVTLDALTGKTYQAQVLTVGPTGTVTQGVVNYPVTFGLTNSDSTIKPGMTANLNIEVERRDNTLLIPTRAVRAQGNQKIVTVQANGQTATKPVTTGLSNDTYVEILSGLQEGDLVVVNQTTTRTTNLPGGGMGIPGMGGPGGPPP